MIPSDFRLDIVGARLIERLEATRATYGTDPEQSMAAFRRAAHAHVQSAIEEYREYADGESASAHPHFLEREILETALPRYHRHATAMSAAEAGGFGFGRLAEPLGVLVLVGLAALIFYVVLLRLLASPLLWPLVVFDLCLPLLPTIAGALQRRRYRGQLEQLVADLGRIQDAERAYGGAEERRPDRQKNRPPIREVE